MKIPTEIVIFSLVIVASIYLLAGYILLIAANYFLNIFIPVTMSTIFGFSIIIYCIEGMYLSLFLSNKKTNNNEDT